MRTSEETRDLLDFIDDVSRRKGLADALAEVCHQLECHMGELAEAEREARTPAQRGATLWELQDAARGEARLHAGEHGLGGDLSGIAGEIADSLTPSRPGELFRLLQDHSELDQIPDLGLCGHRPSITRVARVSVCESIREAALEELESLEQERGRRSPERSRAAGPSR